MLNSGMLKTHFTRRQFEQAARDLGVELAAVIAVAEVEAPRGPFEGGHPAILFERHLFHRLTAGRFGVSDISNPEPGGYGKLADQWPKLERARKLDEEAALKACSWGAWQILGENHRAAGFPTVHAMVEAMADPAQQLAAFVSFVKAKKLAAPLRTHNWLTFARVYNGPRQRGYDAKILAAFDAAKERIRAGGW